MRFRTRLFISFLLAGIGPIVVLAFIVRHETTRRLTTMYEAQVASQIQAIEAGLEDVNQDIEKTLNKIKTRLLDNNRLRAALAEQTSFDRRFVLDYALEELHAEDLSMLQLQDSRGRILSSGHFRNEYDRIEETLPDMLASGRNRAMLIEARYPEGSFYVLARVVSVTLGNNRYDLVGGVAIDADFVTKFQHSPDLQVLMQAPEGQETTFGEPIDSENFGEGSIVSEVTFPFIPLSRAEVSSAKFIVLHNQTALLTLRESVNRWFIIVGSVAVFMGLLVLTWASLRISRPLVELADKTSKLDLDKLDVKFESDRKDEIGSLSRLLGEMTGRLRKSATLIKDAERRAAIGDLARQVNHDIKNGLTPLRNVFRHLAQLADSNPEEMPEVFNERKETLNSSIGYLQELAANYARLTPRTLRTPCNLNDIVFQVAKDARSLGRARVQTKLANRAEVRSDPLALRRIIENLVGNAIDSLVSKGGRVLISTEYFAADDDRAEVRLIVEDNGIGMTKEQAAKVFQDFYTTKENGTGLGLSIVRRLVMDLDGAIRVESEPGKGTRVILNLPAS